MTDKQSDKKRKLTPKQSLFVREYLIDLNASQAALRAGYSPKNVESIGYQLLHKTPVMAVVERLKAKREQKTEINAEFVLENIRRLADKAEASGNLQVALKAYELLGKHLSLFVGRIENSGAMTVTIERGDELSDVERTARLAALLDGVRMRNPKD